MSGTLKVLGMIDLVSALAFVMLIFNISILFTFMLFCIILLFVKGLSIISGDFLGVIDLLSSIVLIFALFISVPVIILLIPGFLLLAKAIVSFF